MAIADKLTLLASSKESLRVKLGLPENLPLSEYYKYALTHPDASILALFAGITQGAWYDPSDKSTLFQDVAGTVPVTKDGDPVALMKDRSGNGNHATQTVSTSRPVYKTDGVLHWLEFDGVDDVMFFSKINLGLNNTTSVAFQNTGTGSGFIVGGSGNQKIGRLSQSFFVRVTNNGSSKLLGISSLKNIVITAGLYGGIFYSNLDGSYSEQAETQTNTPVEWDRLGNVNSDGQAQRGAIYGLIAVSNHSSDIVEKVHTYQSTRAGVTL